jgi:hypothetical protein
MIHDEKYCADLLLKVLEDLKHQRGEDFYDRNVPFQSRFEKNCKSLYDGSIIENCWITYATVPKDGWRGGKIMIDINDNTGKAVTFVNTSLGGRPITFPLAIDGEGKYYIPITLIME